MALTPQQKADIEAAYPQLATLAGADQQVRTAADLAALKQTAKNIVTEIAALVANGAAIVAANPAAAAEVNAAKVTFVSAAKAALGL
jgi:adenylosuccinate synthase